MTYMLFLVIFLFTPIALLGWWQRRRLTGFQIRLMALMSLVALIYTTPWDNYLVATQVWWYDPALVTGITFGWVPLEEYMFFLLQPFLSGLILFWLSGRLTGPNSTAPLRAVWRRAVLGVGIAVWLGVVGLLMFGPASTTYLSLTLGWALPPILFQLWFGLEILWRRRRLVGAAITVSTLYLSAADALAISAGTWTISPEQTLKLYLGGILPLEEFLFFLVTNILLVFGMVLFRAPESQVRVSARFRQKLVSLGLAPQ